jgi:signal transduction histidine kinase
MTGTGIGLAVVAQLTEMHDGRVRVEDADRGGARFIIELPAAEQRAPVADRPPVEQVQV